MFAGISFLLYHCLACHRAETHYSSPFGFGKVVFNFKARKVYTFTTEHEQRSIGLTHKRLEVTVTLPQGIITERRREPNKTRHPCIIVLIVWARGYIFWTTFRSLLHRRDVIGR